MSFEELKEVFVDTLNCDADKVTMEASLTEDLQADSLDAVELNMAFEDKFGITIADEDLGTLKTVGDLHPLPCQGSFWRRQPMYALAYDTES